MHPPRNWFALQLKTISTVYLDTYLNTNDQIMSLSSLVLLGLGLLATPLAAQPQGTWEGAIALPNLQLTIHVHFAEQDGNLTATIDIPQQGAKGLPLQNVRVEADTVYFELQAGPGLATFNGTFQSPDRIAGTFQQASITAPFHLDKAADQEPEDEPDTPGEAIELDTGTGTLHGTLVLPEQTSPVPVALLIAGSGPTDRDGNTRAGTIQLENNSLRMVAEGLAEHGIATVRYDKRGVAGSIGAATTEADLRFDHYVADAIAWLKKLNSDERFSDTFVIGHSEGALLATLAAQQVAVEGAILIAGAGRSAPVILQEQLSKQLGSSDLEAATNILDQLSAGETVDDVPTTLATLFRPSVQPYMISWFRYDPAQEIAKLTVPILLVQGTTDIQVPEADAHLLADAHPNANLLVLNGMNHVLKTASGDRMAQMPVYTDPSLPLHDGLLEHLLAFLQQK